MDRNLSITKLYKYCEKMRLKLTLKGGTRIQLPIVIAREGDWYVASVPMLDVATQGKSLKEVKENMVDLLTLYFENPHTPKPKIKNLINIDVMLSTISVVVPKGVYNSPSGNFCA